MTCSLFKDVFLILCSLILSMEGLSAEVMTEIPQTAWVRTFGEDRLLHTAKAMGISPIAKSVILAGSSSLAGGSGESASSWLWVISENGKRTQEVLLNRFRNDRKVNPFHPYVCCIANLHNDDVVLVVEFLENRPSVVRVNKNGEVLFRKLTDRSQKDRTFFEIIPAKRDALLLIGSEHGNALVVKIDSWGKKLWEKVIDRGKVESFIDGLHREDDSFVLVGDSSIYRSSFFPGPSEVWVVKLDAKGNILSEKTFPGRYGGIAKGKDDSYVIVYDKSDSANQDIRLQALDANLGQLWAEKLLTMQTNVPGRFNIVSVANGGFVVAGSTEDHRLWISKIDNRGRQIWTYRGDANNKSVGMNNLISFNGELYILTPVYSENQNRQVNYKIGLIKFHQK